MPLMIAYLRSKFKLIPEDSINRTCLRRDLDPTWFRQTKESSQGMISAHIDISKSWICTPLCGDISV